MLTRELSLGYRFVQLLQQQQQHSPGLGSQLQQRPVLLGCWDAMGCWDPIYVLCYSATAMIQCYSTTGTTINVF
jgi:hypothetical protein